MLNIEKRKPQLGGAVNIREFYRDGFQEALAMDTFLELANSFKYQPEIIFRMEKGILRLFSEETQAHGGAPLGGIMCITPEINYCLLPGLAHVLTAFLVDLFVAVAGGSYTDSDLVDGINKLHDAVDKKLNETLYSGVLWGEEGLRKYYLHSVVDVLTVLNNLVEHMAGLKEGCTFDEADSLVEKQIATIGAVPGPVSDPFKAKGTRHVSAVDVFQTEEAKRKLYRRLLTPQDLGELDPEHRAANLFRYIVSTLAVLDSLLYPDHDMKPTTLTRYLAIETCDWENCVHKMCTPGAAAPPDETRIRGTESTPPYTLGCICCPGIKRPTELEQWMIGGGYHG